MFYDRVMFLCKNKGISLTYLVTKILHMSVSNVTKWKDGNVPKLDTAQNIANYFGVPVDYLMGNEQKNKPTAESDRLKGFVNQIVMKLDHVSDDGLAKIADYIDMVLAQEVAQKHNR